jgi:TetR/AcrR family transcriptional regulator, regulator of cefoperazone and chloramphenicol sensitivity
MVHPFARHRAAGQGRGEEMRLRILETALQVFATEGYEGASTRQLAERAGVNLPAIQYYFGSKEGLFRAVIDRIIERTESHMAPLAAEVQAALADPTTPRDELVELLCRILEAFVALGTGGPHVEAKRQLIARSEVEDAPGFEQLHASGKHHIFKPCRELTARLLGAAPDDDHIELRAMALLGQVMIFYHKDAHAPGITPERVQAFQTLVREHTLAIFRFLEPEASVH